MGSSRLRFGLDVGGNGVQKWGHGGRLYGSTVEGCRNGRDRTWYRLPAAADLRYAFKEDDERGQKQDEEPENPDAEKGHRLRRELVSTARCIAATLE